MAAPAPPHAPAPQSSWLFGPATDLLLGCGVLYGLSIPALLWLSSSSGITQWSFTAATTLALAINTPHYGATLLRVYEQREDRRKYALFALHLSAAWWLAFAAALYWHPLGSLLVTLYFTWAPWHFAGQNYGLALMLSRRRGVAVSPQAKRWFYASFVLSFSLAFLALHVEDSTAVYSAGVERTGQTFELVRIGLPAEVVGAVAPLVFAAYLLSIGAAAAGLLRTSSPRQLVPAALLVAMQALWFALPALGVTTGRFALDALPFAAIWISVAHSTQYLWVTAYYARRTESATPLAPFLLKSLLAGATIIAVPALVFWPGALSPVTWSAGLSILVFSVVNLHHFMLDGAVWKLRDGRVARALLRPSDAPTPAAGPAPARAFGGRALVWALGAVSVALPALAIADHWQGTHAQVDSVERAEAAARRLAWIGRSDPDVWSHLASLRLERGEVDAAIACYREALAAQAHWVHGNNLAFVLASRRGSDPQSAAEAVRLAEEAAGAAGGRNVGTLDTLAVAYAAAGRFSEARSTASLALELARAQGDPALLREIRERVSLYLQDRPYTIQ
jgi:tetratricopeptide (TPR) repeat protein